jgi:hypothetical protein
VSTLFARVVGVAGLAALKFTFDASQNAAAKNCDTSDGANKRLNQKTAGPRIQVSEMKNKMHDVSLLIDSL